MADTDLTVVDTFMEQALSAKQMWLTAIDSDEPLKIAFAESRAKRLLLASLKDADISAELLAFCDPELAMIEVIQHCSDHDKVRIVAIAILTGFAPGNQEFSVYGGKTPSLYIKEQGYRTLFARLSNCTSPDVNAGHPVWTTLGKDKQVWLVEGDASCSRGGVDHRVDCSGKFSIGIPGHATDNIDSVKAKARRRLLQLLWKKVSTASLNDSEDDYTEPATVVVKPSPAINEQPAEPVPEQSGSDNPWADEFTRLQTQRAKDAWNMLETTATVAGIEKIRKHLPGEIKDTKDREIVSRFADYCLDQLAAEVGA